MLRFQRECQTEVPLNCLVQTSLTMCLNGQVSAEVEWDPPREYELAGPQSQLVDLLGAVGTNCPDSIVVTGKSKDGSTRVFGATAREWLYVASADKLVDLEVEDAVYGVSKPRVYDVPGLVNLWIAQKSNHFQPVLDAFNSSKQLKVHCDPSRVNHYEKSPLWLLFDHPFWNVKANKDGCNEMTKVDPFEALRKQTNLLKDIKEQLIKFKGLTESQDAAKLVEWVNNC